MLHPDDISRLCQRKYTAFLKSVATGEPFFPLNIRFGRPSSTAEWDRLQTEITALAESSLGYRIEWGETNTRRWGRQKFPERVWFENEDDFLRAVRKRQEVAQFRANLALTREQLPGLNDWLPANVAAVVEYAAVWPDLLTVCQYFNAHPRPGLYPRELPISVDTKFIERHEGVLRGLLDHLLPDEARTDADRFEERYGLRYDEPLVRIRLLDPSLKANLGLPLDDLAVPLARFRALDWNELLVLVTENKMTFLTLPPISGSIAVWGGGGAAELLTSVDWLDRCRILYWGDVDAHGFHILSRLRRRFPELTSIMMTTPALDLFSRFVVPARKAAYEDVAGLTQEEVRLYRRVVADSILLEQEKIPHTHAVQEIEAACQRLVRARPA